jgi:hypothetical protein
MGGEESREWRAESSRCGRVIGVIVIARDSREELTTGGTDGCHSRGGRRDSMDLSRRFAISLAMTRTVVRELFFQFA